MRQLNVAAVFAIVLGMVPSAGAKLAKSGDASVGFTGVGPAGLKIVGSTTELSIEDDGKSVTVSVPLKNLTTGIALRDRHMREKYLQTEQYPTAELTVDRATLKFPSGGETSGDATGTLKLHGTSRPIAFHYTATPVAAALNVSGSARININDFGVVIPKYLGVTMNPAVDIRATFTTTR